MVLAHEEIRLKKWGCNDMDGTTLCGGMTMKREKCMMSGTKRENDEIRTQGHRWDEWLLVMDKMNDFGSGIG